MKAISLLTLFVLSLPIVAQTKSEAGGNVPVQSPAAGVQSETPEMVANRKAFLNLPEEKRNEFFKGLDEAIRLFQQKRVFETLDELAKISAIIEGSPDVYNLRGSCFVEMRAFDKALVEFNKADALVKNNPSYQFNIAEVYFCTKQWKKCLDLLEEILKNAGDQNMALTRIVEFKKLLCQKKLGMDAEAKKLGDKYDFQDDSPFYYYAQAALAYEAKDAVKAEEWLAMASRVFQDPKMLEPWQDTMVEYGYIKSFYGEDSTAAGQ